MSDYGCDPLAAVRARQQVPGSPVRHEQCPALWEGNDTVEGLQDRFPCELPRGHDGDHQYTARWNEEYHFLPGRNPDGTGRLVYSRVS
jgi:hypothetical protein